MIKEEKATQRDTIKSLLLSTGRDGIDKLVYWLENDTDFFDAPASTKYHGAYSGGLADHSFTVLLRLVELVNNYGYGFTYQYDSLIITALLHDVCKANCYKLTTRNVKNQDTGEWEVVPVYTFDEEFKFGGHGSKSVYLIMRFIELTENEASAINCHMGAYDKSAFSDPGAVYAQNPLAWFLHVADECATYIDEQ